MRLRTAMSAAALGLVMLGAISARPHTASLANGAGADCIELAEISVARVCLESFGDAVRVRGVVGDRMSAMADGGCVVGDRDTPDCVTSHRAGTWQERTSGMREEGLSFSRATV